LFNGKDLAGWKLRLAKTPNHWKVAGGVLVNTAGKGTDLYTEARFDDFTLHVEFNVPKDSNSGVSLRGQQGAPIGRVWLYGALVGVCFVSAGCLWYGLVSLRSGAFPKGGGDSQI
jgi:hypothetical protein